MKIFFFSGLLGCKGVSSNAFAITKQCEWVWFLESHNLVLFTGPYIEEGCPQLLMGRYKDE